MNLIKWTEIFKQIIFWNPLPSKQSVWLPSRHTQMSRHCSSRLRNKTNFRRRSWVWINVMHCLDKAYIKANCLHLWHYFLHTQKGLFTSGVKTLRWDTTAGTDMIWRRKERSRLSEKWAATTGLEHNRFLLLTRMDTSNLSKHSDVAKLQRFIQVKKIKYEYTSKTKRK